MSASIKNFIRTHIEVYLRFSRLNAATLGSLSSQRETSHMPPTSQEVEDLIIYLKSKGVEPIIVGSSALAQHLKLTEQDMYSAAFRSTKDLDIFVLIYRY